jgi:hypothetical protein
LKSSQALKVGTKILCRKCGNKFQVSDEPPATAEIAAPEQAFVFDRDEPVLAGAAANGHAGPRPGEVLTEFQFTSPAVPSTPEPAPASGLLKPAPEAFAFGPAEATPAAAGIQQSAGPLTAATPASAPTPAVAVAWPGAISQTQSINPYVLGLVFGLSVMFVASAVALIVVCLSRPADKKTNEEGPPSPPVVRVQNIPTKHVVEKKLDGEKPAISSPVVQEKKPKVENPVLEEPVEKKTPAVEKKPDGDKPAVAEKKPDPPKPDEPKPNQPPVVDDSQLAGSLRLTPYLVTVHKPKPLTKTMKLGLKWLASQQKEDGGWGEGGISQLRFGKRQNPIRGPQGAAMPDPSNVADTCIASLALLRSGSTPTEGPYARNISQSIAYVCKKVEEADADTLFLSKPDGPQVNAKNPFMIRGGTLVQMKIGTHVDTFLAALLLSEVKDRMPDAEGDKRVTRALSKLVGKMDRNQSEDGMWTSQKGGYNAWAPVLGQALGTKAVNRARQAGIPVPDQALERAKKYAEKTFDARTGKFSVDARAAGVALYSASGSLAALQDSVNTYRSLEKEINRTALSASTDSLRQSAVSKLTTIKETKKTHLQASKVVVKNLGNQRFVSGFGNNGGEEFLSYMNISEALAAQGGKDWTNWDKFMTRNLSRVQNKDGSWAGHHCITGRTFCTASALLVLMADRAPVPVAVKIKE